VEKWKPTTTHIRNYVEDRTAFFLNTNQTFTAKPSFFLPLYNEFTYCYGLVGPAIESRWKHDFLHPSKRALGPTQPPTQWVLGLFTPR